MPTVTRRQLLVLLVATQAADAATTAVGLAGAPGVVERNPVLATFVEALGTVPALVLGSALVVASLVLVTEAGCAVLEADEERRDAAVAVRVVGYVPFSVLSATAAINNALVVSAV